MRESQKKYSRKILAIETIAHIPKQKRKKDTWSQVTIHKKWVQVSVVERLVFSVRMYTQFFTFYFNCMTK